MTHYEYLNHVLANYFSANVEEANEMLAAQKVRQHMSESPQYAEGLRADLLSALSDTGLLWKSVLAEFEVAHIETEQEARAYAINILRPLTSDGTCGPLWVWSCLS